MIDVRIIECAKALRMKCREAGLPFALTSDQAVDLARASVLKWLEQKMTDTMHEAGERIIDNQEYAHDRPTPTLRNAFHAINAQAAKEIG